MDILQQEKLMESSIYHFYRWKTSQLQAEETANDADSNTRAKNDKTKAPIKVSEKYKRVLNVIAQEFPDSIRSSTDEAKGAATATNAACPPSAQAYIASGTVPEVHRRFIGYSQLYNDHCALQRKFNDCMMQLRRYQPVPMQQQGNWNPSNTADYNTNSNTPNFTSMMPRGPAPSMMMGQSGGGGPWAAPTLMNVNGSGMGMNNNRMMMMMQPPQGPPAAAMATSPPAQAPVTVPQPSPAITGTVPAKRKYVKKKDRESTKPQAAENESAEPPRSNKRGRPSKNVTPTRKNGRSASTPSTETPSKRMTRSTQTIVNPTFIDPPKGRKSTAKVPTPTKVSAAPTNANAIDGKAYSFDPNVGTDHDFPTLFEDRIEVLRAFKQLFGDLLVHNHSFGNHKLCLWINTIREAYQKRQMNPSSFEEENPKKRNQLTSDRINKLNAIGFDWTGIPTGVALDSKSSAPPPTTAAVAPGKKTKKGATEDDASDAFPDSYEERLEVLKEYQKKNGHIMVRYSENPRLVQWMRALREAYRIGLKDKESLNKSKPKRNQLTNDRIAQLDKLGFQWG